MVDIRIGRVIIAAIVIMIIGQIVHSLSTMATMGYYTNPEYFAVWSSMMMEIPKGDMTFMFYSLLFGFIGGLLFALVYNIFRESVPGKTPFNKGLAYGFLIFLVAGLSGSLSFYLLFNLPVELIVVWAFEGLIIYLLTGITTAYLVKERKRRFPF